MESVQGEDIIRPESLGRVSFKTGDPTRACCGLRIPPTAHKKHTMCPLRLRVQIFVRQTQKRLHRIYYTQCKEGRGNK